MDVESNRSFWATDDLVSAYRERASGDLSWEGGDPEGFEDRFGIPVLKLADGGLLVGTQAGGPVHWLPPAQAVAWAETTGTAGDLGRAMSDLHFEVGQPRQDFELGYLVQNGDGAVTSVVPSRQEALGALAEVVPPEGGLVSVRSGENWWIDANEARFWVPDELIRICLGDRIAPIPEAPGWAVGSRRDGGPATCDLLD